MTIIYLYSPMEAQTRMRRRKKASIFLSGVAFSEIAAELSVPYAKLVVKLVKVNARIGERAGGLEERMNRIKTRIDTSNKRGARLRWRDECEAGVGGLETCIGIRIQASLLN